MTSVSFLHVHLEDSEDGEDEEQESNATTNLFSQIPDLSDFLSGHRRAGKRKEKKRPQLDSRVKEVGLVISFKEMLCSKGANNKSGSTLWMCMPVWVLFLTA